MCGMRPSTAVATRYVQPNYNMHARSSSAPSRGGITSEPRLGFDCWGGISGYVTMSPNYIAPVMRIGPGRHNAWSDSWPNPWLEARDN